MQVFKEIVAMDNAHSLMSKYGASEIITGKLWREIGTDVIVVLEGTFIKQLLLLLR